MRQDNIGSTQRTGRSSRSRRSAARRARAACDASSAVARLRCAYFAIAGDSASRYRVSFDRVVEHLWRARRFNQRFTLSDVVQIDDLVHAVACIDGHPHAWCDLGERYERALVRRCRSTGEQVQTTLFVRRVLADLRRRTVNDQSERFPSLHSYFGVRPLRLWLADRMIGARTWASVVQEHAWSSPRPCLIQSGNSDFPLGHPLGQPLGA
jgi:hypothetical protein